LPSPQRILLNSPEFACLIKGGALIYKVSAGQVEVRLERLGAKRLLAIILDAVDDQLGTLPPDPKEAREFLPRGTSPEEAATQDLRGRSRRR